MNLSSEYLDVVDEQNKKTGETVLRKKAHTEGIWHRAVHVYFVREESGEIEIITHLRSPHKDINPNKWTTRFGGHVQAGLTNLETVVSEMKEETGLDIKRDSFIEGECRKSNKFPNCEFIQEYFVEFEGDVSDLKLNDGEVVEVKWMRVSEITRSLKKNPEMWGTNSEEFKNVLNLIKKVV